MLLSRACSDFCAEVHLHPRSITVHAKLRRNIINRTTQCGIVDVHHNLEMSGTTLQKTGIISSRQSQCVFVSSQRAHFLQRTSLFANPFKWRCGRLCVRHDSCSEGFLQCPPQRSPFLSAKNKTPDSMACLRFYRVSSPPFVIASANWYRVGTTCLQHAVSAAGAEPALELSV